jgi:protein tyrosine phosphatase (PTP) superfamily phosphohydrolase (DUF442 family)
MGKALTRIAIAGMIAVAVMSCGRVSHAPVRPPASTSPLVPSAEQASPRAEGPLELPGVHNVWRVMDGLYSGSSPEGERGFQSLAELGIRTIISVDGARPEVELARKYGMRYVHVPVGYHGITPEQGRLLALAVRHLPGPIYLHCHHGRHRGPAASMVIRRCLDRSCTAEQVREFLKRAGTDPRYVGLYAVADAFGYLAPDELAVPPASFPEIASVPAMAEAMVQVDHHWHHLQQCQKAGWAVPPDHPDVVPAHEAVQLMEAFREALRLPEAMKQPQEFRDGLADSARLAEELADLLRAQPPQTSAANAVFNRIRQQCTRCHSRFRDVPPESSPQEPASPVR